MRRALVASMYVVSDGKVLLVRHRALDRWLAPGGHIEPDELPHDCAVREVREETGIAARVVSAAPSDVRYERAGVLMLPRPIAVQLEDIEPELQHVDLVYAGVAEGVEVVAREAEVTNVTWADLDEMTALGVPDNVIDVARLALRVVRSS